MKLIGTLFNNSTSYNVTSKRNIQVAISYSISCMVHKQNYRSISASVKENSENSYLRNFLSVSPIIS